MDNTDDLNDLIDTIKTRVYNNVKNDVKIISKLNKNQLDAVISMLKTVDETERFDVLIDIIDNVIDTDIPENANYIMQNFRSDIQKISDMS